MKIYTSYFSNGKKLAENNVVQIGIALYPPKWFKGHTLFEAAPKAFMLRGDLTREEYIKCYERYVLSKLNVESFLKNVELFSDGKDVALCCYEKPEDFCHRHLLADWLNEKANLGVEEFSSIPKVEKKETPVQFELSLFD